MNHGAVANLTAYMVYAIDVRYQKEFWNTVAPAVSTPTPSRGQAGFRHPSLNHAVSPVRIPAGDPYYPKAG